MAEKKGNSVAVWVTTLFLAVVFIMAGWTMLTSHPYWDTTFRHWGYPDWLRQSIGVLTLSAAVLIVFPKTAWIGAATLAVIMIGAVVTFLRHDSLINAAVPGLFLISLSSLAYYRFPRKPPPAP